MARTKEEEREYRRALYRASEERRKARNNSTRKWQKANQERVNKAQRQRYSENLEARRKYAREWYRENRSRAIETSKRCGLKRRYGITPEQRDALGTMCAICGIEGGTTAKNGRRLRLHVDHCHDTGAIRGLLCHHCNTGIGHLKHDVTLLQKAIAYLQRGEMTGT